MLREACPYQKRSFFENCSLPFPRDLPKVQYPAPDGFPHQWMCGSTGSLHISFLQSKHTEFPSQSWVSERERPKSDLLHKIVTTLCWRGDKMAETWGYSRENGMWRCLVIWRLVYFYFRSKQMAPLVPIGRARTDAVTCRCVCASQNWPFTNQPDMDWPVNSSVWYVPQTLRALPVRRLLEKTGRNYLQAFHQLPCSGNQDSQTQSPLEIMLWMLPPQLQTWAHWKIMASDVWPNCLLTHRRTTHFRV